MRQVPSTGGAGTLYWLLSDHLGSVSTVTDALGAVVATQKYWPYGATRATTGTLPTDKQYTGQQIEAGDSALGLYNYKARFYSTVLGRFVSADPVGGSIGDPQSWNAYSYVSNNPLTHSDPTGLCDPDNPSCAQFRPSPWEDASGMSLLAPGLADFLNAPFCWDCYRLERLGASGASSANLIAAAHSTNPEDYLWQVYDYRGHGSSPGPTQAIADFVQRRADVAVEQFKEDPIGTTIVILSAGRGKPVADLTIAEDGIASGPSSRYVRPTGGTTPAQRASVQGSPCVECGAVVPKQYAGHKYPLVKEWYETGAIDKARMRTLGAVESHCPACSNAEGGRLSWYSRLMRQLFGF